MLPGNMLIRNFGSFKEIELDLSAKPLAAIVGENGTGKSTLLDAVLVALYGKAAGPLDGFIRQGEQGFKIALEFTASGQSYRVVREHGKSQKVSLSVLAGNQWKPVAADKVAEADAEIVRIIGYDYASFTTAHWLRQGSLDRFASLDPSERKSWLMSSLDMHVWPALESEAKRRLAEKRERMTRLDAVLSTLEVADIQEITEALAHSEQVRAEHEAMLAAIQEQIDAERGKAAEADRTQDAADRAGDAFLMAQRASQQARERVTTAVSACESAHDSASSSGEIEMPDMAAIEAEFASATLELAKKRAEEERSKSALASAAAWRVRETECANRLMRADAALASASYECPTCGQELRGEAREKSRGTLLAAVEECKKDLQKASDTVMEYELQARLYIGAEADAALKRLSSARLALDHARDTEAAVRQREIAHVQLAEREQSLDSAQKHLEACMEAQAEADAKRQSADAHRVCYDRSVITGLEAAVREHQSLISGQRAESATLTERKARAEASADKRRAAQAEAEVCAREASDLELLAKAYSKNGVPARILDGAVRNIEDDANEFLSRFASGLTVSIATQAEKKTGGVKETLDILVTDSLGTRSISRMSGGEATRVNFALAVGLSRFMSRQNGAVDSFTVDEPEYLDARGLEEFTACLHALSRDVPLVIAVSHIESITESLPERITVKRGPEGSVVE
jgi:exonuclease SbcC